MSFEGETPGTVVPETPPIEPPITEPPPETEPPVEEETDLNAELRALVTEMIAAAEAARVSTELRQGQVSAITGDTLTLTIGGSDVPIPNVAHLGSYTPALNDTVWIIRMGADLLVVGAVSPSGVSTPAGVITAYGGGSAPNGWLLCQGQAVSRASFPKLFAAIGTNYGAGDGSTTFNVPNLQQRFPLGKASAGTGSSLGSTGGAIDHTHGNSGTTSSDAHSHTNPSTSSDSHSHSGDAHTHSGDSHAHGGPSHSHAESSHNHNINSVGDFGTGSGSAVQRATQHDHGGNTGSAGGGQTGTAGSGTTSSAGNGPTSSAGGGQTSSDAHSHTQGSTGSDSHSHTLSGNTGSGNPPYQVVNYIIKA